MLRSNPRAPRPASHRKPRPSSLTILAAALLFLCATAGIARAQDNYPPYQDKYVTDWANALEPADAAGIRDLLQTLDQETGIEMTALIIRSISDYDTGDESFESFATHLFNAWGIGDATRNDGVLILVATEDRKVRIELGSGYGDAYDEKMAAVINEHMLHHFRDGDYGTGIYEGARAIIHALTGEWPAGTQPPSRTASTGSRKGVGLFAVGGGAVALGGAGLGLQKFLRYRRRRCAHCQTPMARLDEASDDVYLDSGQKVEEVLRSVDYDIWKCPNCNTHTLHRYPRLFSSWKPCPKCSYRTLHTDRRTLVAATTTSTGKEEITQTCRHCHYRRVEVVTLPMIQESDDDDGYDSGSSSSSSSSFGGGSSSGGGASDSW